MGDHSMEPATKPQPVLVAQSVLAALAFIFGGLSTMAASSGNEVLAFIGGIGTLLTGGANIGVGFYVRGQVVPLQDVAALVNDDREVVAGPASAVADGSPVDVAAPAPSDQGMV